MKDFLVEHIGIAAHDPCFLSDWYKRTLEFREIFRTEEDGPPIIFLEDASGTKLEIFPWKVGDSALPFENPKGIHIALSVRDFDEAVRQLEERGVRFSSETRQIFGGGKARFLCDPEGNCLHIVFRPTKPW